MSFTAEPTSFGGAYAACGTVGGHLVTITSAAEQARVHSIHLGTPWIGASEDANDTDAVFDWVTTEAFGFTAFAPGEPDDDAAFGGNGECLAIVAADGAWGDTDCNFVGFTDGRICELPVNLCGDGIIEAPEACDDGNRNAGDGCSATCTVESGAVCSGTAPTTCAKLVLNEVDYDQAPPPTSDSAEFVEIYNAGTAPAVLASFALVMVNGGIASPAEYFGFGSTTARIQFSAARDSAGTLQTTLPAGGYLVIGAASLTVPATALRILGGTTDNIQNGATDAVGIMNTTTTQLVDALSYEGDVSSATLSGITGTRDFREGGSGLSVAACGGEAANATSAGSLRRRINGRDTDTTANDWLFSATLSLGVANP